jgi:hypothetical protein
MINKRAGFKVHRRHFLQTAAAATVASGVSSPLFSQVCLPRDGTVRDRLWVFCNPVNADYDYVRKRSVMTPLEGAVYLGVPNMIMVNQYPDRHGGPLPQPDDEGWYKPWEPPFEQYAIPLRVQKRVVWSIVDAGGVTKDWEREQVLAMARRTPNFVGVFMDDFFREAPNPQLASLTPDELRAVQQELKGSGKKLDLYVTFYTQMLTRPVGEYLKLIDVITFWTGETAELANLDQNLTSLEQLAPKSRIMLGCYTAQYDRHRTPRWLPLPIPAMKHQCEVGLQWLREGRIEGIIIYGNFIDLDWDAMEWVRNWVHEVGETKV